MNRKLKVEDIGKVLCRRMGAKEIVRETDIYLGKASNNAWPTVNSGCIVKPSEVGRYWRPIKPKAAKKPATTWIAGIRCRKLKKGVKRLPTDLYSSGESLEKYLSVKGIDQISEAYRPIQKKKPAPCAGKIKAWGITSRGRLNLSWIYKTYGEALSAVDPGTTEQVVAVIISVLTKGAKK